MPSDLALLSTLIGSNYPSLELIFMVQKVFEPLKFDRIWLLCLSNHVIENGDGLVSTGNGCPLHSNISPSSLCPLAVEASRSPKCLLPPESTLSFLCPLAVETSPTPNCFILFERGGGGGGDGGISDT